MKSLTSLIIPDDKVICDLVMDQIGLATVTVADELNLFAFLNDPLNSETKTLQSVTEFLNSQTRTTEVFLRALVSMNFVTLTQNHYGLTQLAHSFLMQGSPVCRVFQLQSNRHGWAHKRVLNLLKNGCDPDSQGELSYTAMWQNNSLTQLAAERFTGMMNTNLSAVAVALSQTQLFDQYKSIVDVGGGSGIFLAAIRQKFADKKLTLFELDLVCDVAKNILKNYVDVSTLDFFKGSFFENQWPRGSEAYFLSNILHDWPKEKGLIILKNIYQSMPQGGSLFVNECLLNEDKCSPKHTVLFDLMMYMNHGAQQYTSSEIIAQLKEAGFKNIRPVFEYGYYTTLHAVKI